MEIAPGSILQRLYLKERLRAMRGGKFVELGSGTGQNSRIILQSGLQGIGVDLNASACKNNLALNRDFVDRGSYDVFHGDFFTFAFHEQFDLIFSCMVIEHMEQDLVDAYFARARDLLKLGGVIITIVPAHMRFWGIEDDIAGHKRRYAFGDFLEIARRFEFSVRANNGLTFPVSNVLLPLSNRIVQNAEAHKKGLPDLEKTVLSGNREVPFKTDFPGYASVLLNEITMYPFHLLQKAFVKSERSMVIYSELARV